MVNALQYTSENLGTSFLAKISRAELELLMSSDFFFFLFFVAILK